VRASGDLLQCSACFFEGNGAHNRGVQFVQSLICQRPLAASQQGFAWRPDARDGGYAELKRGAELALTAAEEAVARLLGIPPSAGRVQGRWTVFRDPFRARVESLSLGP